MQIHQLNRWSALLVCGLLTVPGITAIAAENEAAPAETSTPSALPSTTLSTGDFQSRFGKFTGYTMEQSFFTCDIPVEWELRRDAEEDAEYRIYEIELLAPGPYTSISVRYLFADNEDFNDHEDFLRRNATNLFGKTEGPREKYEPIVRVKVDGLDAYELKRWRMLYRHPESKSEESFELREILYVVPLQDGSFYVVQYAAEGEQYATYLPVFQRVVDSFKARKQEP